MYDAFAECLKAVANGRRLELLELMAQGEHSVEELARLTGLAMTTTSNHLQTLKRAGLVSTRREGSTIFYRLGGDDVAELYAAAKRVAFGRHARARAELDAFMDQPVAQGPVIDPADVTSQMYVIDVRPVAEYEAGHFPGAVSIPVDELDQRLAQVPQGAQVVLYCRGQLCRLAREAAVRLRAKGVDARAMDVGVVEWRADRGADLELA